MWQETIISDDQFLTWCGSHNIKGCGTARMMKLSVDKQSGKSAHGEDDRKIIKCEDCRALAQAQISYKAGIEKVVKWIEEHDWHGKSEWPCHEHPYLGVLEDDWQAFKESLRQGD